MDQFVVPQFIDVEDKIFGPITTRQFIILLVTGLLLFLIFKLADTALFIICLIVIGGFSLVLAFLKINGQAFHYFLLNTIQTRLKPKLRVWNKLYTTQELNELRKPVKVEEVVQPESHVPSQNRIHDLSLLVNTGGYYKPE
jgi:hypothetical protein